MSRPSTQVFRTSTQFSRAPIHPRPTFAYSLPSGARIPVPEQAPDIIIPDATLLDLEASTQPDSVILGTQSRYSATETSSNENYVLTATDKPYSRQFSHASGSSISDDDHKPGLSLASYIVLGTMRLLAFGAFEPRLRHHIQVLFFRLACLRTVQPELP